MLPIHEYSAGIIPFHRAADRPPLYLVIHSATVRNPQARWEFPKGGIEAGETAREAAAREFEEETGLVSWAFRDGFERSLSYTYMRRGRKHFKTVTYFVGEVFDTSTMARSHEHMEDRSGRWSHWGSFEQTNRLLCHAEIRHLFADVDAWLCNFDSESRGRPGSRRGVARDAGHLLPSKGATVWRDADVIPMERIIRELSYHPART